MLKAIFTLDYEIHGNGDGSPYELMVEPTERLLRLFEEYGAKLTIMAEVAEIMRFKEYAKTVGRDEFHAEAIERQLQDAILRGHDVQLHIHSSYFRARCEGGRWIQDWSEYDFAKLAPDRMDWMVKQGKGYLEALLRQVDPDYSCSVFRAANWSVSPSANVVETLASNGIRIDTSVFKHGRRSGLVEFDYSNAASELVPWRVQVDDICVKDDDGPLWEFPIYAESRSVAAFATPQRFYRAILGRFHPVSVSAPAESTEPQAASTHRPSGMNRLLGRHAWKADFNQCSGRQLISAIERADRAFVRTGSPLPFVLIGHPKLFSRLNEWSLRPFLAHVRRHRSRFAFGKFSDFPLPAAPAGFGAGRQELTV